MTDLDHVDRNPADIATPYPRLMDRPTSDAEWTERILAQIANPSMLGAMPGADPMAGEIARLSAVDPPINNLGNEMVFLAAGLASGGALPIGIRATGAGTAVFRGLTAEAEQALAAYARSMMNRLGRMPTADEVLRYLKLARPVIEGINHAIQHASATSQPADQDQQPDWSSTNARWDVDTSGQVAMRPSHGNVQSAHPSAQEVIDLDRLFQRMVSEAQERTGRANDWIRGLGGRSFETYLKDRISRRERYVGRTSGFEGSEENVRKRDRAIPTR